jgi:hypothetical protein
VIILPATRIKVTGFAAYYTAAYILTHQPHNIEHVYDERWFAAQIQQAGFPEVYDVFHFNPPTMSLIFLPLVRLPIAWGRVIWAGMSLLFLSGGLMLLTKACRLPWQWGIWSLLACLLYAPVMSNFWRGQVYLFLFFLLCLAFWALFYHNDQMAGLALGSMLILKVAGGWLCLLLLGVGRWRVLLWVAMAALGLIAVSLPSTGFETWRAYVLQLPQLIASPARYVTAYQTNLSLLGHLFIYDSVLNPVPLVHWPLVAYGLSQLTFLGTLITSIRWGQLNDPLDEVRGLTLGMFLALGVTNVPVAADHHYVLVLPSLWIACWWAWRARLGRREWLVLALAVLMLSLPWPYRTPRLAIGWLALLAYPRVYGAYLLWFWLIWALSKVRR